jgi:hypothetical protein
MGLPNNVEAEIHHANGEIEYIYSPFPVESRWPGVSVDSSKFRTLPVPEKFYQQAIAFLQAAALLCEASGEAGHALQWSQASVCYYCLNIATEPFLKACIQRSAGASKTPTHEISELLASYRKALPDDEFQFPTPWAPSWKEVEAVLEIKVVEEIDHHPDQLFRYGADRSGKASAGIQFFCPDRFFGYISYLNDVWRRAWDKVSNTKANV